MLPQYWLEVRAILLRNDDRLIVQPKLNMKTLGVISAAIWARAALISQTIYVRCFDYRKRACSCRRWTRSIAFDARCSSRSLLCDGVCPEFEALMPTSKRGSVRDEKSQHTYNDLLISFVDVTISERQLQGETSNARDTATPLPFSPGPTFNKKAI